VRQVKAILHSNALDRASLKSAGQQGPTKAFEVSWANQLWMTDGMWGPSVPVVEGQKPVRAHLLALIDDCIRLCPHAQYYPAEKIECFLDLLNRPLLSRMGFCLELPAWPQELCGQYIGKRLADVGIRENIFDPDAEQLLLRIAGGIPRAINHLGQRAFEEAARDRSRQVHAVHVQHALEQLPWLGTIHKE
jgi:hypothetical protein